MPSERGNGVDDEEPLTGGNISSGVVRVGDTVRRPTGPWTPTVHALLRHLEARAFTGAPRVYGIDAHRREVLEFLDGVVPWPDRHHEVLGSLDAMARVGALLRAFHDAVADFDPGPDAVWQFPEMAADAAPFADARGVIVCHNDPAAWNLVIADDRAAFIDWDVIGPRPPIWDVAYCAIGCVPISPDPTPSDWTFAVPTRDRIHALADGYGLSAADRARLPEVIVARAASSYAHLRRRAEAGVAPWDELWRNGHGDAWAAMRDFAAAHAAQWATS